MCSRVLSRSGAGLERMQASSAAGSVCLQPTAMLRFWNAVIFGAATRLAGGSKVAVPDSMIAARNMGLLAETVMRSSTETDPADSPKIVTMDGSPPNAAILSCTHFERHMLVEKAGIPGCDRQSTGAGITEYCFCLVRESRRDATHRSSCSWEWQQ